MVCKAGTLLVPSGTSYNADQRHLHIICTDPDEAGKVVLVSVTTWTNDLCDDTCILLDHDHRWLWKPKSWVCYRKADFFDVVALERGLRDGAIEEEEPCNGQIFLKVRNGLCRSPHTPRKIKRHMGCP